MRTDTPPLQKLADYTPFAFRIPAVALDVRLDPEATEVTARLSVVRSGAPDAVLMLDGDGLSLRELRVDGRLLGPDEYTLSDQGLAIPGLPERCEVSTRVVINPAANTALSGLYLSGGRYCTQCEAEGFRRIIFWPDRPDVMSRFRVRIEADRATCPILLSNGTPVAQETLSGGRHAAVWEDPHPKPSYLFALCAGDYDVLEDRFTTRSGREVRLGIHVDKGDKMRAAYAMDSLKRAMAWDEVVFGCEYDLDVFTIVAVRDFNFGAMENKGLNIFNASYVLADAETATDADFEAIESIVGHEYFHNWTGNRITCRDWFQLCLKEGLTVFRDQEFSADMRSRPVQRIKDVIRLRTRQFPEDAGPLAHPVRPTEMAAIDNLYTATVYEKGAELIRMLKAMIGPDAFARGMALYFERCDGRAVTLEDFYACFEESAGRSLKDFLRWYSQPGTPVLAVTTDPRAPAGVLSLSIRQAQPHSGPTGCAAPPALPMPLDLAVFDAVTGRTLEVNGLPGHLTSREVHLFLPLDDAQAEPLVSFNRGFAAPVRVEQNLSAAQRLRLAEIETDPFNLWDGLQVLLAGAILARAEGRDEPVARARLVQAVLDAVARHRDDPAFAALLLRVPQVTDLFMECDPADPVRLQTARRALRTELARAFAPQARALLEGPEPTPFRPDAAQAGVRALRGAAAGLLALTGETDDMALLKHLFDRAQSMTECLAALTALCDSASPPAQDALDAFYRRWEGRDSVVDKWFTVQATLADAGSVERVSALTTHPRFDLRNPNRVRSLIGAFAFSNLAGFHRPDGAGHRLMVEMVQIIDPLNPALAARLLGAFEPWRRLEPAARSHAEQALRLLASGRLSRNAADIVNRALG
jgi:aminopeptidase N